MEIEKISEEYTYILTREIARGGMGAVCEAQLQGAEGFTKKVAVKLILDKIMNDSQFEEMFIGEAKLVANLIHQNIAQVYQLGKVKNSYYIAMEYINGYNLEEFMTRHLIKGNPIPHDVATFITSRVCRGLAYAHNKRDDQGKLLNLVHRDVSPKNIMIALEGEVKITDFGIAKANTYFKDLEGEVIMGKAEYMSPEQAQYKKTDGRSDLFSLGIVFYELLTGKNPFYHDDIRKTLDNVVEVTPPPPSSLNKEISETIDAIMDKVFQKDVEKRYQNGAQMLYDLEFYMYHDRYGPTCETLAKYIHELFDRKDSSSYLMEEPEQKNASSTIRRKVNADDPES